ncbi:MAG: hypothetical protein JO222_02170, partial [Frankiales bacterium]|nr:hypothetical protein [Frankiales bacterium]
TNFQQEFGELDSIGMVRFVADQVVETVLEHAAVRSIAQRIVDAVPGRDDEVNLLDRDWQLSMFRWREKHALDGVARRLRSGMSDGSDPFDVFNSVQDHLLLAAQAHIDREVLELFATAVEGSEDPGAAELLGVLCDLHALSMIERDRAWFLEHGRLTPARAKAVLSTVNQLCQRVRPHAELLVEAFGIPDPVLAAPIALGEEARRQQAKGQPTEPDPE